MSVIFPLIILGGIVIGAIFIVRRVMEKRETTPSDGGDVIAYLLMALAVGVTGFSLAELGQAAFPGDSFVFDTDRLIATSLAGLVVATPVAGFLWRRQAARRAQYPQSGGWTIYLSLIEAVFMTATVIAAFSILNWALGDGGAPTWTDLIVFGGIVVLHEWAARRTPPASDAADLPRVVGSAIGLITLAIGLGGSLFWLFDTLYATLQPTAGASDGVGRWASLIIIGAPIWWYRWWRPWHVEPGAPRNAWTFLTSVAGLSTAIGAGGWLITQILIFMFTDTETAGAFFEFLPGQLSVGVVGLLVWGHHRHRLGRERSDPVRAYEYSMAAIGLGTAVGSATALTAVALEPSDFVGVRTEALISVTTILVIALVTWGWFWSRASQAPRETEAVAAPRRFYLLGVGIVAGLVAAGALIGTLVVLFQGLLGVGVGDTLAVQAALFVYSGAATWHLLRARAEDRAMVESDEVVTPYDVTLVCSHPGLIADSFPKEAKLKVIYRDDEAGVIDEELAARIVDAVAHRSSLVWVDEDGYRIAPMR